MLINRFDNCNGVLVKLDTKIILDEMIKIGNNTYELVGAVHHHGNYISSGHYTSMVKFDTYYICNDNSIRAKQYSEIRCSDTAYMLFYKLRVD